MPKLYIKIIYTFILYIYFYLQENIPPSDYEPVSKVARPRFGVLQPVPGVPCMPLEEQVDR